jgi:TRAP-type C4-dicarboxylate transport system permease small subunit
MAEQPKAQEDDARTAHPETNATPDEQATNEQRAESVDPAASVSSESGAQEPSRSSLRPPSVSPPATSGAPWGAGLQRFFDAWTRVETYLCVVVVVAEILALVAWVILKGLGTPRSAGTPTGTIVRAVVGATVLGLVAYFATRKQSLLVQRVSNTLAILAGLFTGGLWAAVGVTYFANILNWLQDASSLTLIGGLRGLGTRLTIWLAMVGGSLAAANGKHIHIDVVMRFVPRKARLGATLVTWVGAAAVCFVAAWGFVDHIAIESYDAGRDAPAGEKIATIGRHTSEGFFILRKQFALDLSTLPCVLAGNEYDRWLTNEEWNRRVEGAGWEDHFTPDQVASLKMPADVAKDYRLPVVMVPGSTHQGLLKHLLNLVFPFGFLIIGLRFLLRGVLALSGHVSVDPDAPHASADIHRDQEGAA